MGQEDSRRREDDHQKPIPLNEPDEDDELPLSADSPRCQFIKADGEPCGSPAMKRKRLCYFHSKTTIERSRRKQASAQSGRCSSGRVELPVLEDDLAIQMAVTNICRQLADESIEPKRASTLLYGLQVASVAVRRATQNRRGRNL
jgi:hypothetical protein